MGAEQGHLFEPQAPTADPAARRVRVILAEPVGVLDYAIPEALAAQLEPGTPVQVPLRGRSRSGYVVGFAEGPYEAGGTLRHLEAIDAERQALPEALLTTLVFAADYYGVTAGDMLAAALPESRRRAGERFRLSERGREVQRLGVEEPLGALLGLVAAHPRGVTSVAVERALGLPARRARELLRRAVRAGWLLGRQRAAGPRRIAAFRRCGDPMAVLKPRQLALRRLWEALPEAGTATAAELAATDAQVYRKLQALVALGLVERSEVEVRVAPAPEPSLAEAVPTPTAAQQTAIDHLCAALDGGRFQPFLLEGVTGSGKTEVYLRLIAHALARGQTALVLVPEIALTPQLGARFRARFGDQVATFHSGLTAAERRDEWERVQAGEARVGLGARSAVFLPLARLGVVIVDEEHETSYKQDESPRYNGRDLAVVRARFAGAVAVLGSATPCLETRYNAQVGRYGHLRLPERVASRPLPAVELIDLRKVERLGGGVFTAPLVQAVSETLAAGEQVILFLNRRGFAPYVFCRDCGHAFRCEACDVGLTLHRRRGILSCHYCGVESHVPDECPKCHGLRLDAAGLGVEKLEDEIHALFGPVELARLHRDHVRSRRDIDRELTRFRSGVARILLGTQMVTKGHDFPGVTLVGVLAADASLNFPDFRAAERTFQLLTQVAGRAGRGDRPGRVLVQAFEVEHYAIQCAARHDYDAFVALELESRRAPLYPPFVHLTLLRVESDDEAAGRKDAEAWAQELRVALPEVEVVGPAAAPLARLEDRWRFHLLLKARQRGALRGRLVAPTGTSGQRLRRIVDVDPYSML